MMNMNSHGLTYLYHFSHNSFEYSTWFTVLNLAVFLFDFFKAIIFTFRNYFTLCKIVLCIWRIIIFFSHHNFMKKSRSKLSKNEPENIPQIKITWYGGNFLCKEDYQYLLRQAYIKLIQIFVYIWVSHICVVFNV